MPKTPCDDCRLQKGCDWLSILCRLTDAEVAQRSDLIKPTRRQALQRRDEMRREEQIKRDAANPYGVFARRRNRQRLSANQGG